MDNVHVICLYIRNRRCKLELSNETCTGQRGTTVCQLTSSEFSALIQVYIFVYIVKIRVEMYSSCSLLLLLKGVWTHQSDYNVFTKTEH